MYFPGVVAGLLLGREAGEFTGLGSAGRLEGRVRLKIENKNTKFSLIIGEKIPAGAFWLPFIHTLCVPKEKFLLLNIIF